MREKVSIQKPCAAVLESMERVPGGVFCTSCNLVVRDFTSYSDEELIAWMSTNKGKKSCGIFRNEQAKIPFFQKLTLPFRYAAVSIVAFFAVKQGHSQKCTVPHYVQTDSSKIISIH